MGRWAVEDTQKVEVLWKEGHSAGQIEKITGITRNAVIGKIHRLGLGRDRGVVIQRSRAKAPAAGKSRGFVPARPAFPPRDPANWEPGPKGGVTFDKLRDGRCKWPLGPLDQPAERFCGASVYKGNRSRSYCACHYGRAYALTKRQIAEGVQLLPPSEKAA